MMPYYFAHALSVEFIPLARRVLLGGERRDGKDCSAPRRLGLDVPESSWQAQHLGGYRGLMTCVD